MKTNTPAIRVTDQGPVAAAESAILAGVQTDINTAFVGDANPGLTTPQGQLAQSLRRHVSQCICPPSVHTTNQNRCLKCDLNTP